MHNEENVQRAAEIVAGADALVITAGAGIGVDSGLPDFRGNEGFWRAYPALAQAGLAFTEVASPHTFEHDSALAWGFYGHRLALYRRIQPHAGFGILRRWMEGKALGGWVFTSNVDGHFQKAGFAPEQINECHGSIHHLQCMHPDCASGVWSADAYAPEVDDLACRLLNPPPRCPQCGALARPNILMFGDWGWLDTRNALQRQREAQWLELVATSGAKVAVVELGAGTAVPSVRHFGHRLCKVLGARMVRINPREFSVPHSQDVGLAMGSLDALRAMDHALGAARR